jgi:hypothetical protein
MEEFNLNTWEEFEQELKKLRETREKFSEYQSPLLFRGQKNACWSLSPTLEREKDRMLFRDYYQMISRISSADRDAGRYSRADSRLPRGGNAVARVP